MTKPKRTTSLSPEQHALRSQGLGASEVAAVLGLDPYRTALDVYLEKTGQTPPFEGNRFTKWGVRLEDDIVDEYQERHPDIVFADGTTQIGPEPWMLATPDRIVNLYHAGAALTPERWGLECKCRGQYDGGSWGEDGTDEVPHAVAVQCHWGMIVTGLRRWDVAVLLGGNDYREYTLKYDGELAAELVARASAFWHGHVLPKVHPPFSGAESDHRFLLHTYPTHSDEMIVATPEINTLAAQLQLLRSSLKQVEEEKSRVEAQVKEFIGQRLGVEGAFGKITWTHMAEVPVKAFVRPAHRRLTVKFAKEGA